MLSYLTTAVNGIVRTTAGRVVVSAAPDQVEGVGIAFGAATLPVNRTRHSLQVPFDD
jgi:hypothetical protein